MAVPMTTPTEMQMLFDAMWEAWSYFENIHDDCLERVQRANLGRLAILHVHAISTLAQDNIKAIRSYQRCDLWQLKRYLDQPANPAFRFAQEKCHRLLERSLNCLNSLIEQLFDYARQLERLDSSVRAPWQHLRGLETMMDNLIRKRLPRDLGEKPGTCSGRIHPLDSLVWTGAESNAERRLLRAMAPAIKWRDFSYEILPATSAAHDSWTSAELTVEKSFERAHGEKMSHVDIDKATQKQLRDLTKQGKRLELLSLLALNITPTKFLNLPVRCIFHDFGIILPGGSRVFHPSVPQRSFEKDDVYVR